jgi:dihydroflavonol-4-reductase
VESVFLTGASGFIGSHVLRALVEAGHPVRALRRPDSAPLPPLEGVREVMGDLARPGEIVPALRGCRYLIHTGAVYSFSPGDRRATSAINVRGTKGLLEAARIAGIERAVVTSSSATVGPATGNAPATEENWAPEEPGTAAYHRSNIAAERVALAARVPAVLLLPTMPVGPGDWKPTPTGQMIVDFMRGRIFASLPGGVNVVPVEDVARAHVLALTRGTPRERYLLGGENLMLSDLWRALASICRRPAPTREIPYAVALGFGWMEELRCRLQRGSRPLAPLEGVRMARHRMHVSSEKASRELGFEPGPARAALERAVQWYADNGYARS